MCRWFLDHQDTQPAGRHRPHVNLIVDMVDFEAGRSGGSVDGTILDPASVSVLACDSALQRVMVARAPSSTTERPPAPCRPRCGTRSWCATAAAGSAAATVLRRGARRTTFDGGRTSRLRARYTARSRDVLARQHGWCVGRIAGNLRPCLAETGGLIG
jgi:hypothetical protein